MNHPLIATGGADISLSQVAAGSLGNPYIDYNKAFERLAQGPMGKVLLNCAS